MRHAAGGLVRLFGALFAVTAALAVVLGWRLSEGPIAVGFMLPWLQEQIGALPGGATMTVGDAIVVWDGSRRALDFRLVDISLTAAGGQRVISAPQAALSFDGEAALQGEVRLRSVAARGLRLLLRRGAGGGLSVGLAGTDEAAAADLTPLASIMDQLFGPDRRRDGAFSRLDRLELRDSRILLNDARLDRIVGLKAATLSVRALERSIAMQAELEIDRPGFRLPLDAELLLDRESGALQLALEVAPFDPSALVATFGAPDMLEALQFPVSGNVRLSIDAAGRFGPVDFTAATGAGQMVLPGVMAAPLPIRTLTATGRYLPATRSLQVEAARYDSGAVVVDASGTVGLTGDAPDVDLVLAGDGVPLVLTPAYWPLGRAAVARDWIESHVRGGTATRVRARLAVPGEMWGRVDGPADMLSVELDFADATVRLYEPFPDIRKASGRLRISARDFELWLERGQSAGLALGEGHLHIDDFAADRPVMSVGLVAGGSIAAMLEATLRGPLALPPGQLPVGGQIGGQAAARLELKVPLRAATAWDDLEVRASANLSQVAIDRIVGDWSLRADALTLRVDRNGLEVAGQAAVNGVPLGLRWVEDFAAASPWPRHVEASGRLDRDAAARLGLALPDWVGGEAGLSAGIHVDAGGGQAIALAADLADLSLHPPGFGWAKDAGTAGRLSFDLFAAADGSWRLGRLQAQAPDLRLRGSLSAAGGLLPDRIELEELRLGETEVAAGATRDGQAWTVSLTGPRVDLRPFLAGDGDDSPPDLPMAQVSFDIGRLVLDDSRTVHEAAGVIALQGDRVQSLDAVGSIGGTGPVSVTLDEAEGRRLLVESGDAGAVLSAAGFTGAVTGGRLKLEARLDDDGAASGIFSIDDFRLTETPGFARLLSLASLTGIGQALSGEGLSFARAEIPFARTARRIDISNGRMSGPAVGATTEGYYLFDTDEIRLVGNLIPAYSLSRALGSIPLLGTILGGDQGLFGVTYVVEGDIDAPEMSANPVSALAPGILRRMFLEPVDPSKIPRPQTGPINDR